MLEASRVSELIIEVRSLLIPRLLRRGRDRESRRLKRATSRKKSRSSAMGPTWRSRCMCESTKPQGAGRRGDVISRQFFG